MDALQIKNLPTFGFYSTVAELPQNCHKKTGAWSIVLELNPADGGQHQKTTCAVARFLVAYAPWEKLKPGYRFELYEGRHCTAIISVM
jgi:hypothetical protein